MSFFIPGRTTCSICNETIARRWHAAQLPFVDPSEVSDLAPLSRRYVHRACWNDWQQRSRYQDAARALRLRASDSNEVEHLVSEEDGCFVYQIQATSGFRLDDVYMLVTIELNPELVQGFVHWLLATEESASSSECDLETEAWQAKRRDHGVEFTRTQSGAPIERFWLSDERYHQWLSQLGKLQALSVSMPLPAR